MYALVCECQRNPTAQHESIAASTAVTFGRREIAGSLSFSIQ